jgi:transcriptional regulator with XRE-family HTH domain
MTEHSDDRDRAIGAAIRQARFGRGLTQEDLAQRLGITRAAVASYETGRRKILAETLMDIASVCGKPLSFFDPTAPIPAPASPVSAPKDAAIQAMVHALAAHPGVLPQVMAYMETVLAEQLPDDAA